MNINQQNNATSIAIDGGEATAIQQANQYNDNEQFADAAAQNVQIQETAFEDVGTVNVVIGNGNGQQFDGWGIADKKGDKADIDADQSADTVVTQSQVVGQLNYNEQSTAFALAENGSDAIALQQSQQSNQNLQHGAANATNVYQALVTSAISPLMRRSHRNKPSTRRTTTNRTAPSPSQSVTTAPQRRFS